MADDGDSSSPAKADEDNSKTQDVDNTGQDSWENVNNADEDKSKTQDVDNTGQGSWGNDNNAGPEPPLEAIRVNKIASIAILTDSKGNVARIGGLTNAASPICVVSIESVTENYETYFCVQGRFPSSKNAQNFQYMGFRFYGDAFQSFDRDFLLTRITEADKLPDMLKDDTQAITAITEKGDLCKLELTFQPDKVVTKDKDDPEEFSMSDSSHAAKLLRELVEGEGPKQLTLCFRANDVRFGDLKDLKDRLLHEQKVLPFREYRDSKGKIVIQYGAEGFEPAVDRPVMQQTQSTFRTADQHAATLAYGELRDHALTVELARQTLETEVPISFVAIPGWLDKNKLPTKYIGFVDIMDTASIGQLFQAGATATLCFDKPKTTVEPKGWHCEVKGEIANVEHPGTLTLLVTRPKENTVIVNTAKCPSLSMTKESYYPVWVYPHGNDTSCKRIVDAVNKYLHGPEAESAAAREKRMSLQKFLSGREHTALPKPKKNLFDRSKLKAEQLLELEKLEARCSPDQRAVLDKIYSCQSAVHMVQGPPGTGKTSFAATILVPILNLFGLKANCYAPSNVATDVFAEMIPYELGVIRYHGLGKEKLGVEEHNEVDHRSVVPIYDAEAMSADELVWMTVLAAATTSDSWLTPGKKSRRNFKSLSLYIRAFQHAGIMNAQGMLSRSLPATVRREYMKWAQHFYKLGIDNTDPENVTKFKDLTEKLFQDTLDAAKFVVTTCSNAADETLRKHTAPDVVIVDEVGVAKESETLMAMFHNFKSATLYINLGDHKQLSPTVPSLHVKRRIGDEDEDSPPYNIFARQMDTSLMTRLLESGMEFSMFKQQFRMTGGIQEFSSRLCYHGKLQNADSTLLARRPQSQKVVDFLHQKFGLVTDVPHLCMNVQTGVCLNSRTKSRKNLPNVIIDMYVVELVLEAGLFEPHEIAIITPYKEQAHSIRQALWKASNTDAWKGKNIDQVQVHTVDSMQGNESAMIITDFVMAQKRQGKFGFVTNRGRINVSMSRAKFFQVFVGDLAAADPIKPKDPPADGEQKDDVQNEDAKDKADGDDDEVIVEEPPRETFEKPIKLLFDYYKASNVVVDTSHTDKAQKEYVDLTETDEFLAKYFKSANCHKCEKPGHKGRDCPEPDLLVKCLRCSEIGHRVQKCPLPKPAFCFHCKKEGHNTSYCPDRECFKCKEKGHSIKVCEGPERRTCARCEEVGHLIGQCNEKRFKSRNPAPPKRNLEAGKPTRESSQGQTTTSGQDLTSGGGGGGTSTWDDGTANTWDDGGANTSGGGGVGASTANTFDDGGANEHGGDGDHSDGEASEPSEIEGSVRSYD